MEGEERKVGGGARRGGKWESYQPCYFRHQYGESMDIHVLDFKCKSVNFDNFFRNKIFGLQLFVPIASFPIHVSGIGPWLKDIRKFKCSQH